MKNISIVCILLYLISGSYSVSAAANSCTNPDPKSFTQVSQCFSSQASPFIANIGMSGCDQITLQYMGLLRRAGANKQLLEQPPSCSIFAKVAEEISGQPPFWQSCVNYDGSKQHFATCLTAIIKQSDKNQNINASCQALTMLYRTTLDRAKNTVKIQPEYKALTCDDMLDALSSSNIAINGLECAQFNANDISAHIRQCLADDPQLTAKLDKVDCNTLRNVYQAKLQQIYGTMPEGYKVLGCSQINQTIEQLKKQVAESTALPSIQAIIAEVSPVTHSNASPVSQKSDSILALKEKSRESRRQSEKYHPPQISRDTNATNTEVTQHPLVRVKPKYPVKAEKDSIEGWVTLRFNINEQGQVTDIDIISASPKRVFDREAKRALQKWKYKPHVIDGKPSKIIGQEETIEFKLAKI